MYENAVNLISFLGKDAEVKAAQDKHELHRAQPGHQGELKKQTNE